jgi:pimeloyl-ACP methyl ester carboxylesterase
MFGLEPGRITWGGLVAAGLICAIVASASRGDELKRAALLGAKIEPLTDELRERHGLNADDGGVVISQIFPGTTAEAEDLRPGDVLLTGEGKRIDDSLQVVKLISSHRAGDEVRFEISRDGKKTARKITLRGRPRETSDKFEVIYGRVESRGHGLRTIVTRPKSPGRYPALFLIQGVGLFSIDNPIGMNSAYKSIIEDFGQRGYVTLRVDKPGCGDSEGGPAMDVDFESELDGYRQGLKALKALPFVDPEGVVLLGHSMGGVMAPLLATEVPVKGIAVYGTIGTTWIEYMLENSRRQLILVDEEPEAIETRMRRSAAILHYLYTEKREPAEIKSQHPELAGMIDESMTEGKYFFGRTLTFFRQLADTNLAAAWSKLDAAVLAMWGRADYVSAEADHAWIAAIVNREHPGRATFLPLDGTGHGFQKAASPQEAFRARGTEEFNPASLAVLREWVDRIVESSKREQSRGRK